MSFVGSNRFKIFPYIFIIAITALLITLFTKGIVFTIVLSVGIGVILYFTQKIWLPVGYGRYAVRLVSLAVALSAALTFGFWQGLLEKIVKSAIETHLPEFAAKYPVKEASPYLIFIFLGVVIWIVNYYNRDKGAMEVHPHPDSYRSIDKDISPRSFRERLKGVCSSLRDDLRIIDERTGWDNKDFIPLDAEVEFTRRSRKKKKVLDLLRTIKKSRDRLLLVLGDPGSGKSVALRKLAQDLAKESSKSGRIPIYIDLKEWSVEQKWDKSFPPTAKQLYDFVLQNVKSRNPINEEFFDRYFYRLYENGMLYFILDSFDEIPVVLNEKDNSPLIHQLSEVVFKFLKGARADRSQGILASRIFRKPTREFLAQTILEIRPFSDASIIKVFKRSYSYSQKMIEQLFKERMDLVPVVRNPFSAKLISDYARFNNNDLPCNQTEMYFSYVERTLDNCIDLIEKKGLTEKKVKACCVEIADRMFQEYGLDAPVDQLCHEINDCPVTDIIEILISAHLGRTGSSDENQFSFVHRRFTEYFAVQKLIEDGKRVDFQSIPADSQWRDALVLYCEVAEESAASEIAEFCWDVIKTADKAQNMRVIHCMRFLRDAFRGRLECIQSFRSELAEYIYKQLDKENNTVSVKLAVETVGLLDNENIDRCIIKAMELNNYWINETAVKSCRHLASISRELVRKVIDYIDSFDLFTFLKRRNKLKFSFSLSVGFAKVKTFLKFRTFDTFFLLGSLAIISLIFPVFLFIVFLVLFVSSISDILWGSGRNEVISMKELSIELRSLSFFVLSIIYLLDYEVLKAFLSFKLDGMNIAYLRFLILFSLLSTIPLYKILRYTKDISGFRVMRFVKFFLRFVVASIVIFPLLFLIIGVIATLKIALYIYLVFAILLLSKSLSNYYLDYRRLLMIKTVKIYKREDIHEHFVGFKTEFGRGRFVLFLEANVNTVEGKWPDEKILHVSDKESYIRLAQLEEKWLGLDR